MCRPFFKIKLDEVVMRKSKINRMLSTKELDGINGGGGEELNVMVQSSSMSDNPLDPPKEESSGLGGYETTVVETSGGATGETTAVEITVGSETSPTNLEKDSSGFDPNAQAAVEEAAKAELAEKAAAEAAAEKAAAEAAIKATLDAQAADDQAARDSNRGDFNRGGSEQGVSSRAGTPAEGRVPDSN